MIGRLSSRISETAIGRANRAAASDPALRHASRDRLSKEIAPMGIGSGENITSVLQETRRFPPPADFTAAAYIKSEAQYEEMWWRAKDDPAGFWGELANHLHWYRK